MTKREQITANPNKTFNALVRTKEQNKIFTQIRKENLKDVKCLTTKKIEVATMISLLKMLLNNQI